MGIENHATVVGINNYPDAPLTGCEADARAIKKALATHADGLKNFKVDLLLSSKQLVSKGAIVRAFRKAFSSRDARIVLFYFSGHDTHHDRD